ncbi:LPS export ABC transporter permease LptF [Bdellovibrionota bacterium FG-1]
MPKKRIFTSRIDRYVLTEVAAPFLGGTIFFIFVFMMFQALRLADFFIIHGVSLPLLGKMAGLMALSFIPNALPVAFLIAVLIGFGRLSADSELVAMKASGFSLYRLAGPPLFLAILVSMGSIALNQEWVPWGERAFKDTLIRVSNTKVVSSIKQGTFNSGFFDLLIFADKVDAKSNRLERVFIFDEREPKNPLTVVAQWGEIVQVKTESDLANAVMLKLYDGSIHQNNQKESTYQKIDFGEYNLYLKIDEGAGNTSMKPHMYSHAELLKWISNTKLENFDGRESRGEYWRRYAAALAPLLFVFLGIGFGTVRTRAVRAGAALTAFTVFVCYWGSQTVASVWMQRGWLPPWFAMEIPNLLMLAGAVVSFRRAAW